VAREVAAPGVRAGAGSREDARSSHQPSTRLARSPPRASVSLQERPDLRSLPPDLSTEVGDLKCKGSPWSDSAQGRRSGTEKTATEDEAMRTFLSRATERGSQGREIFYLAVGPIL